MDLVIDTERLTNFSIHHFLTNNRGWEGCYLPVIDRSTGDLFELKIHTNRFYLTAIDHPKNQRY